MTNDSSDVTRRKFLGLIVAAPVVLATSTALVQAALAAEARARKATQRDPLDLTPECGDDDEPTPSETAGPFFKTKSPKRASLIEPGIEGTRLVVTGRVFARDCRPLAGALLDFWQADNDGEYDLEGYRMRGHQFADAQGRYRLETVVPGLYPGRTRHIHVRVQAPKGRILTTQLYMPDEPRNRRDGLFDPVLQMKLGADDGKARRAGFSFVLDQA